MRIIEPSVENITPNKYDIESIYKHIEKCARTCYKSLDKVTDDSYKKFCGMLKTNKHLSTYEHGTVYLKVPVSITIVAVADVLLNNLLDSPYCHYTIQGDYYYISTNLRVLIEQGVEEEFLKFLCEPTEYHEKRYTFRVVTDRAMLTETTRHRSLSFSVESQRYCNYSKDKYNNEITFVKPHWYNGEIGQLKPMYSTTDDWGSLICEYYFNTTPEAGYQSSVKENYLFALEVAEKLYLSLLDKGVKPQDARAVLPNSCKTEIVVTGFESDWKHFLSLRSPKAGATGVHPDMQYLANQIYDYFKFIIQNK